MPTKRVVSSARSAFGFHHGFISKISSSSFLVGILLRGSSSSSFRLGLSFNSHHHVHRLRSIDATFGHNNRFFHIHQRHRFSSFQTITTNTRSTTTPTQNYMTSETMSEESSKNYKLVDIGANLLDERFTDGIYFGKVRHEPDWDEVLQRAVDNDVTHIILTAGTLRESKRAVDLVRQLRSQNSTLTFGCTVGVHPTRCSQEFLNREDGKSSDDVLNELQDIAIDGLVDNSVVAIGEIGLDYDRLEFCSKEIQQEYFVKQLETFHSSSELKKLPLFLHNRNVGSDLLEVLKKQGKDIQGVVHSFDDTLELAQEFIEIGMYIGLNGCSLKTEENLQVVKELPLEKILVETDCPYCEIKRTHASHKYVKTEFPNKKAEKKFEKGLMVKGRNEPCQLIQVVEVISGVKGLDVEEVANQCYVNSMELYASIGFGGDS